MLIMFKLYVLYYANIYIKDKYCRRVIPVLNLQQFTNLTIYVPFM